jgi:formylglycine-generating enzyme required for sulfatase activity
MGNNPSRFFKRSRFLGLGKRHDLKMPPVERVSWYDSIEFCNKKSEMEGLEKCYSGSGDNIKCDFTKNGYRLPTEAEWEYAARGGNKSRGYKYAGSNNIAEVAWYSSNSNHKTHPVGQKQPNELGIYDMSGNVWEWCNDRYDKNYYKNSPRNNPQGPKSGNSYVLRGGSWNNYGYYCRVANRDRYSRNLSYYDIGFRFSRSP